MDTLGTCHKPCEEKYEKLTANFASLGSRFSRSSWG